jgi:uncharacterized protein
MFSRKKPMSLRNETLHFIEGPAGRLELKTHGLELQHHHQHHQLNPSDFNHSISLTKQVGIVCHPHPLYQGTMDNKVVTTIVRSYQELGLATVRFNFRGVGQSEGQYGEGRGECDDLLSVIKWVQKSFYDDVLLHLAGFSFGSYISAKVAAKLTHEKTNQNLISLLSIAAPVNHFPLDKIALPTCPWIIIHGDEDEVVPFEKVLTWINQLQGEKDDIEFIIMKGASHFFHGRLLDLQTAIEGAMKKWVSKDKN